METPETKNAPEATEVETPVVATAETPEVTASEFDPKSVKSLKDARDLLATAHADLATANARITELEGEMKAEASKANATITQLRADVTEQATAIETLKGEKTELEGQVTALEETAKTAEQEGARQAAEAGVPPIDADAGDEGNVQASEQTAEQLVVTWKKLKKDGKHAEARQLFAANKAKFKSLI